MSEKKLSIKNYIGYALGDMDGVITFGTIGSFLQMFYTDVLHISLPKITVLMLIARIWEAINDPICGALIDSRKPTKFGRFRPYVFWFSVPLAIVFVLTFIKIPGLSENQYLIYAYITYILYGMLYTAVNIPYGSMASAMTNDLKERSTLSVIRSLGAGFGSAPGQILLPLFVYSTVAETGAKYLHAGKLTTGVIILAGFSVIIYFAFFKLTREYIPAKHHENRHDTFYRLTELSKNRPFMMLCLASMLLIAGSMYTQTVFNYLFKNYYGKPGMFSLVTVFNYIPMLALMPFMGKFVERFGKKEICSFGSLIAAIAFLILFFMKTESPYVFLVVILLGGFGLSFFTLEVWAMVTDVIDYNEMKNQHRREATTYASFSFFRKLGQTLAGIGATMAMAAIGYNTAEGVVEQTAAVNNGIYTIATIVPFIMYLAMFLFLQFGYNLTKKYVQTVRETLDAANEE
ncbi:MAG: glycoside-pentoside-hexuronide (GPH):cation symporter [Clostridiales bacterium]|nr:glycoside-pentoside-hexuronide (GPH):cation symporter [Clostridiales bacterium]